MRIAVAQLDAGTSPSSNLERLSRAARHARAAGVEALLFPEVYDVGYNLDLIRDEAPWREEQLRAIADENQLTLVGGLIETPGPYNTLKVVPPGSGSITTYRKRHLVSFMREPEAFQAGDELVSTELGGLRWGFLICYDLRFPEQARALALNHSVDVLCIVSAWPFPRDEHWRTLLRARAIENQCYVVACNRVGQAGRYQFCGFSAVIDPSGLTVCEAGSDEEDLLLADLSIDLVRETREKVPVRKDIRRGT